MTTLTGARKTANTGTTASAKPKPVKALSTDAKTTPAHISRICGMSNTMSVVINVTLPLGRPVPDFPGRANSAR